MGGVFAVIIGYIIVIVMTAVIYYYLEFRKNKLLFKVDGNSSSEKRKLKNCSLITIVFAPVSASLGVGLSYFLWDFNQWQSHWEQPLLHTSVVLLGYLVGAIIGGLIGYAVCPSKEPAGPGEIPGNFLPYYYAYLGILIGALPVASLSSYLIFRTTNLG